MELSRDLNELLQLFRSHNVEFIVVGAHALAFHGTPRFTGDLDLFVGTSRENGTRILAALEEFGFGGIGLSLEDFTTPNRVVQLGQPPSRVDLLTGISGVSWDEARTSVAEGVFGNQAVQILGREALIANKRATGRIRDKADLEALGE